MSEGETAGDRFARLKAAADAEPERVCVVCRQYLDHPEFRGKMFAPKPGGLAAGQIPMSFSQTLVHIAGGIDNLIEHWEIEK